ncbi:MAG: TrmB family transcriptional regulator [Candidatus Aenigmarchaeota archaeon]|nr:TrmB family transcriptional regulator [Candidatus Aenigmarchaeota archaeon]
MDYVLKSAGFTDNESRVYLALLRMGSTTAGALIKALGMHRAAVYDTLGMLVEKGAVSFVIKGNKKYFEAQDPERLLGYLETKKQLLETQKIRLQKEVPRLRSMRTISREDQEGYVYKGREGIKSVCEDVLHEGKEWLVFGSQGNFSKFFPSYYFQMHKRRAELGIPMKIIRNVSTKGAKWSINLKFREERFLPDAYTTPSTTYIYGDKVAIIVWSPDPMAFVVRSRSVAESYRKYFEVFWKVAKP